MHFSSFAEETYYILLSEGLSIQKDREQKVIQEKKILGNYRKHGKKK